MTTPRTVAYLPLTAGEPADAQTKADMLQYAQTRGLANVEWLEEDGAGQSLESAPLIAQVLAELQPGDYVLVNHLSHLGRSLVECLGTLACAIEQGVGIEVVAGGWPFDPALPSLAQCLGMAVTIEKALLSQRTKQALAARKQAGLTLGRPTGSGQSRLDHYRTEIATLLANGASQQFIAARYGTTAANLSRWMKKRDLKRWQEYFVTSAVPLVKGQAPPSAQEQANPSLNHSQDDTIAHGDA